MSPRGQVVGGLRTYVDSGRVRFVMLGGFTLAPDRQSVLAPIEERVRPSGRAVDPALWRLGRPRAGRPFRVELGGVQVDLRQTELYDMRPGRP